MRTEIITIGDEILIGQIVDTNSAWMGQKLIEAGATVERITTVSDRVDAISNAIDNALDSKMDLILLTGGLGPTKDDVTKMALCSYFKCQLVFDENISKELKERFANLNKTLTAATESQAYIPEICSPLSNRFGTAPGMLFRSGESSLVSMPGVPYEMKAIMEDHVLPLVQKNAKEYLRHRTTLTANVPESILAEKLTAFYNDLPANFKLAYLPHMNLVRVRISGKGSDERALNDILDNLQNELIGILGPIAIANEDISLAQVLGTHLKARGETISVAESCTGGYVSHLITRNAGCSDYYPGSVVTYSYEVKTNELGIPSETLWEGGAVSEEVVVQMAEHVRKKMNTTYGLALSGIAGPSGGTETKPVGTVWIAACNSESTVTKCYQLKGDRIQNIERSALLGLELLRKLLMGELETAASGIVRH